MCGCGCITHVTTFRTNMDGTLTEDHNVPSLGRMLYVYSSVFFRNGFNVFHFGLQVSFHIANLRLEISGNEVTPGENRENLHPVKFPMYSKTSNNGPSEKRTTPLQQTAHLPPIDFTIELIHYEPPRSGHLSTLNNGH